MEDALRAPQLGSNMSQYALVLILVLMEDALREKLIYFEGITKKCLNPCFNGRCTARYIVKLLNSKQ